MIDALGYLDEIPVCVGYEVDGKVTRISPTPTLSRAKPVLEVLPGWKQDVRGSPGMRICPRIAGRISNL